MHMREPFARRRVESAHHAPGRLLRFDAQDGGSSAVQFERQMQLGRRRHVQLMNRRVCSPGWRADATSSSGVKVQTAVGDALAPRLAASRIAGLSRHKISCARDWPSGSSRWQQDMSVVMDCCKKKAAAILGFDAHGAGRESETSGQMHFAVLPGCLLQQLALR